MQLLKLQSKQWNYT